jgi:hypothetical protein
MITYSIHIDNTIQPNGELDPAIFDAEFQEVVLDGCILQKKNFVKWCRMIFEDDLSTRSENKIFNKEFGTWFVHKIGQKGVKKSMALSDDFEKNFITKKFKSPKPFLSLLDFLKLDWNNVEKQFLEDKFISKCIEDKKLKIQKIIRKAKRIKNKQNDGIINKEKIS